MVRARRSHHRNHKFHEFHEPKEDGFARFVKFVVWAGLPKPTRSALAICECIKTATTTPWEPQAWNSNWPEPSPERLKVSVRTGRSAPAIPESSIAPKAAVWTPQAQ